MRCEGDVKVGQNAARGQKELADKAVEEVVYVGGSVESVGQHAAVVSRPWLQFVLVIRQRIPKTKSKVRNQISEKENVCICGCAKWVMYAESE